MLSCAMHLPADCALSWLPGEKPGHDLDWLHCPVHDADKDHCMYQHAGLCYFDLDAAGCLTSSPAWAAADPMIIESAEHA